MCGFSDLVREKDSACCSDAAELLLAVTRKAQNSRMETTASVVETDPEIMSGTPVFAGTRVPLYNLFDYLEAGDSLEKFLSSFPSVTREQAIAALELAREAVSRVASSDR
jgi:uncharacterized protein (DUF433 family)